MLALPPAFAALIADETAALATCWRVTRRDGRVFRFTDHDRDLAIGGEAYAAALGYRRTAFSADSSLAVDDATLTGLLDSESITERDLRAGLWDGAEVEAFVVDWRAPDAGRRVLRTGTLGEVTAADDGTYSCELRGLTQALQQRVGGLFQPECRADLGDSRCRVPLRPGRVARAAAYLPGQVVRPPPGPNGWTEEENGVIWRCVAPGATAPAAPDYAGGAGALVQDGAAAFRAEPAWTRAGRVDFVGSPSGFAASPGFGLDDPRAASGWYDGGVLVFETGANAGDHLALEVLSWNAETRAFALLEPARFAVAPGDRFRVSPGCDKRRRTCRDRYDNVVNMRAEPDLPGLDSLLAPAP